MLIIQFSISNFFEPCKNVIFMIFLLSNEDLNELFYSKKIKIKVLSEWKANNRNTHTASDY